MSTERAERSCHAQARQHVMLKSKFMSLCVISYLYLCRTHSCCLSHYSSLQFAGFWPAGGFHGIPSEVNMLLA
jgi:hypothetical protein